MKLVSILGFVIVGILAWWMSSFLSNWIGLYPKNSVPLQGTLMEGFLYEHLNRIVVFVLLLVVLNVALCILKPLLKVIGELPVVSLFNKAAGMLLGGMQAILLLFVITLALRLPFLGNSAELVSASWLKYSEPAVNTLLFYSKDALTQVSVMMNMMDEKKVLSAAEKAEMRSWLLQNHVEEEKVDEIMAAFRDEE